MCLSLYIFCTLRMLNMPLTPAYRGRRLRGIVSFNGASRRVQGGVIDRFHGIAEGFQMIGYCHMLSFLSEAEACLPDREYLPESLPGVPPVRYNGDRYIFDHYKGGNHHEQT